MKEKILKLLKSKLFFSLVLNVIIMIFCIEITSFSYDNIEDFYNSIYISHYHYYYNNDINYIFSILVGSMQFILMGFNCFVLAQVLLSFLSFTSITYIFADKFSKKKSLVFSLLLNILFALNHYADIQRSKTAAILLAAGFILVLNAIRNKRYNTPCWVGVTEIMFGSFLNYEYFFIALGFAVAYFLADMISKRKYKIAFRKFFWYFRPFLLMFVFIGLLAAGLNQYSYSVNHSSEEVSNYYEYSELSDSINNLPYPSYKEHREEFNSVGVTSENDYELLKSGYYDADHSLNNSALSLVSQIQQQENSKTYYSEFLNIFSDIFIHITGFDCFSIFILLFIVFAVIYIIYHKKRFAFFPVFYIIAAIISSVYIRYFFTGTSYLIYGIWLTLFVMLLYSFDFEQRRPNKNIPVPKTGKSMALISGISILCLFICYSAIYQSHIKPINKSNKPSTLYSEINRHPDRYYVFDPNTAVDYFKYTDNYIHPLWGFNSSFLSNIDSFGFFNKVDQLRKRNLPDNIYEAVLKNNKIYVIDNSITFRKEKYFKTYYSNDNSYVAYNQVKEINGFKIYEVSED